MIVDRQLLNRQMQLLASRIRQPGDSAEKTGLIDGLLDLIYEIHDGLEREGRVTLETESAPERIALRQCGFDNPAIGGMPESDY
jgi:hypothetical protein